MALSKQKGGDALLPFKLHAQDSGSPAVQIALLTERIDQLSAHFKTHAKDFTSRHGLLKMVGQRRRLLNYLKTHDFQRYQKVLQALNLRR